MANPPTDSIVGTVSDDKNFMSNAGLYVTFALTKPNLVYNVRRVTRFVLFFLTFSNPSYLVLHGSDSNNTKRTMVLQTILVMNMFSSPSCRALGCSYIHASITLEEPSGWVSFKAYRWCAGPWSAF
jgi:hypothetical protein